jgi:multicomponent K+:H+ antiporter subunit A
LAWPADPLLALLWLIGAGCAVAAAWKAKYHRLAALALAGGTGLVTSITFLWLSAPDLALTQLMVETVTTVLILLGLRWLPPRRRPAHLAGKAPRNTCCGGPATAPWRWPAGWRWPRPATRC